MGLQIIKDIGAFNTTFLEDEIKHPPPEVKGEAATGGSRDKGCSWRPKRISECIGQSKKRKGPA
jgi:hypothetical protein